MCEKQVKSFIMMGLLTALEPRIMSAPALACCRNEEAGNRSIDLDRNSLDPYSLVFKSCSANELKPLVRNRFFHLGCVNTRKLARCQ